MKKLSLKPDPDMAWIYDYSHPDYNTARAQDLRDSRDAAISSAPQWMIREAEINDALKECRGKTPDVTTNE